MLGLPDGIEACLFDLDGVLTKTAKVHAAAWKEMFDDYLRERADRTGEPFVPFDAGADYDEYVDGRPRYDGVRTFLASRGIHLPDGTPDDDPGTETVDGLGNRKNDLVLELIARDGVEVYEGSVRYVRAARDAGLHRAVVSSSSNCRDVLEAAGILDLFEEIVDGIVATREGLKGKPAPDTFLAGARRLGVDAAARGRVRGRRRGRRGGARGRVRVRRRRRPGRPRRRPARARRGHRRPRPRGAPGRGRRVIDHPAFSVEPWALRETALRLELLAQSESLFALANGHIGLRGNLDEGEPNGLPGTYLNGFHEIRPLPYAETAYGNPEAGETVLSVTDGKLMRLLVDDELFDVRYGELDRARARPRLPRRAPAAPRALALAGRRAGPAGLDAHRLARPARRRRDPLRGRARRRSHPGRRAVRADRQPGRPAAGARERRPARRGRDGGAAVRRGALPARRARGSSSTARPTAAC